VLPPSCRLPAWPEISTCSGQNQADSVHLSDSPHGLFVHSDSSSLPSLEAIALRHTSVQHRVRMGVTSASGWCGSHCVFVAVFLAVMMMVPVVVIATPPDAAATALQVMFYPWPRASPCDVIPATPFEPVFSKYSPLHACSHSCKNMDYNIHLFSRNFGAWQGATNASEHQPALRVHCEWRTPSSPRCISS
jgi:hypothetical protein